MKKEMLILKLNQYNLSALTNDEIINLEGDGIIAKVGELAGKIAGHAHNAFDAYCRMYDNAYKNGYRGPF